MLSKIITKLETFIDVPRHRINTRLKRVAGKKTRPVHIAGDTFNQSKMRNQTGSEPSANQRFTP